MPMEEREYLRVARRLFDEPVELIGGDPRAFKETHRNRAVSDVLSAHARVICPYLVGKTGEPGKFTKQLAPAARRTMGEIHNCRHNAQRLVHELCS